MTALSAYELSVLSRLVFGHALTPKGGAISQAYEVLLSRGLVKDGQVTRKGKKNLIVGGWASSPAGRLMTHFDQVPEPHFNCRCSLTPVV